MQPKKAFKGNHLRSLLNVQIPGLQNLHFNAYYGNPYTTEILEILTKDFNSN